MAAWVVRRYSPAGELAEVVSLPVAQVTSCAFGGEDLGELYVTSASTGLGRRERRRQPHAGGVFRLRPAVGGRPANLFAG